MDPLRVWENRVLINIHPDAEEDDDDDDDEDDKTALP